jgi:plasmid stability protein
MLHHATKGGTVVEKEATIMPILHVRGIPDDLYEQIKERAALEHRSLTAEVIYLLELGIATDRGDDSLALVLAQARRLRESLEARGGEVDSTALIREERERRTRQLLGE